MARKKNKKTEMITIEKSNKKDIIETYAKVIDVDLLNVRKNPSTSAPILGKYSKNNIVKLLESDPIWYEGEPWYYVANVYGLTGWCMGKYLLIYQDAEYKEVDIVCSSNLY